MLVATNVMGSLPDNPFSLGLRQAAADALPVPFVAELNLLLVDAGLPTLPEARVQEPQAFVDLGWIDPVLVPVPSGTSIPVATPTTSRPAPVRTPRPADADLILEKPDSNLVGTWALDYTEGWTHYYTIEAQGDGYFVTFVDITGPGDTRSDALPIIESQSWDGTVLTVVVSSPSWVAIETIRIETFGPRFAYGTISQDLPTGNYYSGRITLYRIP